MAAGTLRIGSLCTGYGGLDMAVHHLMGSELAWLSDNDKHACELLKVRFPGVDNIGDIKEVKWDEVQQVDVLTAGYPCQPFSQAGKRLGVDDPRHLWPFIHEAVGALRPGVVVLENVRNHLRIGFAQVLGDLAEIGYDATWAIVRASDVGAPHRRERLFIVAHPHGQQLRVRAGGMAGQASSAEGDSKQRERVWPDAGDGGAVVAHAEGAERRDTQHEHLGVAVGSAPEPRERLGESEVATHATSSGREPRRPTSEAVSEPSQEQRLGRCGGLVDFGVFTDAIARWELVIGRPAPSPVDGKRLSPPFVEWMMGLPAGWVTDLDLPRSAQLRLLGNGVVPQQAIHALGHLLKRSGVMTGAAA